MTALTIASNVAANIGIEAPGFLQKNPDTLARSMLSLLNRSGSNLASKRGAFGESWNELTRRAHITTTPGQSEYALPQGLVNIIADTVWDRTTLYPTPGPITPQMWQRLKGSVIQQAYITPRYRISFSGNQQVMLLDPTPEDVEEIHFEFVSRLWVRENGSNQITKDAITRDDDEPVFPSQLLELDLEWRMKDARGLAYAAQLAEFEIERDRLFALSGSMRTIQMGDTVIGEGYAARDYTVQT